jgi:hypothetical protein
MVKIKELSLLGLDESFPDSVYVLAHPSTGRFGCFCFDGVHGLACFSAESGAVRFSEWFDLSGMATSELTFDEAREVAQARPMPVVALMLLDEVTNPKIHYVR